ncbi:MAG: hypothetical protein H7A23_14750 [Leptospiraceae bacterium]|nr:hypothetical protein [Leptospiraceae bacterium]MCP5495809.1 hypothetical protein [Leptospiraceae bacterium]
MEKSNEIIPLFNNAREIIQPIRLNYNIKNPNQVIKKIYKLKCIGKEGEVYNWYYSNEVLKTGYKIEEKTKMFESWILGKIRIRAAELKITVNSIERAILAIEFFDNHIGKTNLWLETMDMYTKLREHKQENANYYLHLENFFENKPIKPRISKKEKEILDALMDKKLDKKTKDIKLSQFMEVTANKKESEYENFEPTLYHEEGIESLKTSLTYSQLLAYRHLQGETDLTMRQMIAETVSRLR